MLPPMRPRDRRTSFVSGCDRSSSSVAKPHDISMYEEGSLGGTGEGRKASAYANTQTHTRGTLPHLRTHAACAYVCTCILTRSSPACPLEYSPHSASYVCARGT